MVRLKVKASELSFVGTKVEGRGMKAHDSTQSIHIKKNHELICPCDLLHVEEEAEMNVLTLCLPAHVVV